MPYSLESVSGFQELLRFRRNPPEYVAEAARRRVDIRSLRFGARRIFQVNHPDLIRDVLVTHDWNFVKGPALRASRPILGRGLLTSEGELHRRQRRLVQPAFHTERLASYAQTMVECADATSRSWASGAQVAIDQEMMKLTLQIVGRTLFSVDLKNDAAGVGESLTRALRLFLMLNSPVTQLLSPLRRVGEWKSAQIRCEIEQVLLPVIDDHRRHEHQYDDMLSMLIRSSDDGGAGYMSDELLLEESLTLFLAGHETTANALTWTWYLLAEHPEVAQKVHAEVVKVCGALLPKLSDLPQLSYTSQVFREALRLYPPAWVIAREAVTHYQLGPVEVPAGSTVVMSPYATHRDPRLWKNPEAFDPDRWRDEIAATRPKFAFFPFGAGSRVCIGERFAMMEGILLLATLARQWRLDLIPGQRVELWPQITLRPRRSIRMQLQDRSAELDSRSAPTEALQSS